MIPSSPKPGATKSEKRVFKIIRDADGTDEYFGLHSVGLPKHERKNYSEADFVLVGPLGIFCLEVKGGEIHVRNGVWEIGWPGSSYTSKKSPFEQAQTARWPIIKGVSDNLGSNLRNISVVGWGVVFPDTTFEIDRNEWSLEVVYDQKDIAESFLAYIKRLEQYERTRNSDTKRRQPQQLGPNKVKEIVDFIRGDFDAIPSLKGLISESVRELVSLSSDQFKVLDFILNEDNPRILCEGSAGTGKTLIALEAASRLAGNGLDVLFLCFNDNLASSLRKDDRNQSNIHISTVYRFLGEIIDRGGFSHQRESAHASSKGKELFLEIYPRLFDDAATELLQDESLPEYDVVVIDEGQDILNTPVMNCLELVLSGGFSGGRWVFFLDSGLQSEIYGRLDDRVVSHLKAQKPAAFELQENFRNPEDIIKEMCSVIDVCEPICRRKINSIVDYRTYSGEKDQGKKLKTVLTELKGDGIPGSSISILSPHERDKSCVGKFPPDGGYQIHYLDRAEGDPPNGAVTACSVSSFKGLENEIIILTDVPVPEEISPWEQSVIYVGMTRVKTKLFALIDQDFLSARERRSIVGETKEK
jgi:hypothetical protein